MDLLSILGIDELLDLAASRDAPDLEPGELGQLIEIDLNYIDAAIGDLYDLLPAIRNLRRAAILEHQLAAASAEVPEWTTINLIDSTISEADQIVKALESRDRNAEDVDGAMARLIKKERDRLDEWASNLRESSRLGLEQKVQANKILDRLKKEFGKQTAGSRVGTYTDSWYPSSDRCFRDWVGRGRRNECNQ